MKKIYLKIILLILNFALLSSQDSLLAPKYNEFYGVYGSYNINYHLANFQKLPNIPSCCPNYEFGTGNGFSLGLLYERKLADQIYGTLRFGYSSLNGTMESNEPTLLAVNGNLVNGEFKHILESNLSAMSLHLGGYYKVTDNLLASLDFNTSILSNKQYSQREVVSKPDGFVTFLDSNQVDTKSRVRNSFSGEILNTSMLFALNLGVSYQLPMNQEKTLFIQPEVFYNYNYNNVVQNLDWSINNLRIGLAIKYSPNPKEEVIIKEVEIKKDTIPPVIIAKIEKPVIDTVKKVVAEIKVPDSLSNPSEIVVSEPVVDCQSCDWEYSNEKEAIQKNIPYFQTGYWEVNTSENLKRHLQIFETKLYEDASFIELHSKNQYFGYKKYKENTPAFNQSFLKHHNRVQDYTTSAYTVDTNLSIMVKSLTDTLLPEFFEQSKKEINQKLIIQINGYSDLRSVKKGWFVSDKEVNYFAGSFDYNGLKFNTNTPYNVTIKPNAKLLGVVNDTLSKLRAYFGYKAIIDLLMKDAIFKDYVDKGLVLLPDAFKTKEEFTSRLDNAKIVILVEGKKVDTKMTPSKSGYGDKKDDFYTLDWTRRINMTINRVDYFKGAISKPSCCR